MSSLVIYATAAAVAAALLIGWFALRPRARRENGEGLRVVTRTRVGVGRALVLVEVDGRRARPAESDDVFEGIEEELLRASESARHRRWMRS